MQKRDLMILLLAMGIALGVTVSIFMGSRIETGSWGLSFRQEGAPPIGNAGKDQLRCCLYRGFHPEGAVSDL